MQVTTGRTDRIQRNIGLCIRYSDKLQALDSRYAAADAAREEHPGWAAASKEDKDEVLAEEREERYLERLDAGLYTLQLLAALLASVWVSCDAPVPTRLAACVANGSPRTVVFGIAPVKGLEAPKKRAMMLLHQQSISVGEVAQVLEYYAEMVGDKTKQQEQGGEDGGSAEEEAAAAAEAASIRALASVLK